MPATQEKIRRRSPKVYPESINDPALASPLADLLNAYDLPDLWRSMISLLDATLPNYHYVAALPCVEDRPLWVSSSFPEGDTPGYWERFIACEPPLTRVLNAAPFSQLAYMNDYWTHGELAETKFYKQVMEPEGWQFAAGFLFWEGTNYLGHFGMNRTSEQGTYLPHERKLLEDLYPQIAAAVRRVAAFDAERSKRAALEEVLKQAPDGIAILDWEMRIVFSNRAALEACQLWNNLFDSTGEVLPEEVIDAVKSLLSGSEVLLRQPPPGRLETPASEIIHREVNGLRARIRLLHPRAKQAIKPHCLIEFSRVVDRVGNAPAVAAFTLTTAERRVATLVAQGKPNPAVAAELNLSIHTVRAHLREIFSKLNVQHRGELAAALARTEPH